MAGHWNMFGKGTEGTPSQGDVVETLQTQPEGFSAWVTVAFAAEKAAESSDQAHCFSHGRWLGGRLIALLDEADQGLPLGFLKKNRTGHVGHLAPEPRQLGDAPSHYQVDSQAVLEPLGGAELALLDTETALERAVIDFDLPAQCVPVELLDRLFKLAHLQRGEQRPVNRFHPLRRRRLVRFYCPESH